MKSNQLILVAWILLIVMLLPSIIMSSLGLSNLNVFHANRNNYLYQEYNNFTAEIESNYTNSSSNDVTNEIAYLEGLLMQLGFATNNSGSTSMIREGNITWCDIPALCPSIFATLDGRPAATSAYRAYSTVLYGLTFYVIALDPFLNNGPLRIQAASFEGYFFEGTFDTDPFLGNAPPALPTFYTPGNMLPLFVNTSRCDACPKYYPGKSFRLIGPTAGRVLIRQGFRYMGVPAEYNFTLRPETQFLFFR